MGFVRALCKAIDSLNFAVGKVVQWAVLVSILVSAINALVRYLFDTSSNAWLELQWYLFAAVFMLCAGYTHLKNEHVRIDVITSTFSRRTQAWIDIIGGLLFLLPMAILIGWLSLEMVDDAIIRNEHSTDAGGLIRWPVKILIPIGFLLLALQGLSETLKRVLFLAGAGPDPAERQKPQGSHPAEVELPEASR